MTYPVHMHRMAKLILNRSFKGLLSSNFVQNAIGRAQFWTDAIWAPSPRGESVRSNALTLRKILRPWTAGNLSLVRVGNSGDGGYVMATGWGRATGAISIGIGNEDSWDNCLAQAGVRVWQFDHTIPSSPTTHQLVQWRPVGVGPSTIGVSSSLRNLNDLIKMTSMVGDRLILKMDVEGAEWSALCGQDIKCFEQILIELHGLDLQVREQKWSQTREMLLTLTRDHTVVHIHANNCCGTANVAGVVLPRVLEVTLVRSDLLEDLAAARTVGPTELDCPNVPGRREVWYPSFWDESVDGIQ